MPMRGASIVRDTPESPSRGAGPSFSTRAKGALSAQAYPSPSELVVHNGTPVDVSVLDKREPEMIKRCIMLLSYTTIAEQGFVDLGNSDYPDFRHQTAKMGLNDFALQPGSGYWEKMTFDIFEKNPKSIAATATKMTKFAYF